MKLGEKEIILNDTQWEILKQASPHFETARRDYIRNCPRWLSEQVKMIYETATATKIPYGDLTCSICVLRMMQLVGKLYFSELERRKKSEVEIITEKNETNTNGDTNNNKRDAKPDSGNTKTKNGNTGKGKKGKEQK